MPTGFDGANWTSIEPLIAELKARPVSSREALEKWLVDRSDLDAACSERRATLFIATSCNTDDAAASAAFTRFLEEISPKLEVAAFELDKRQVELTGKFPLADERYRVLTRSKVASVELFREANVPVQTELSKLSQDYGKVAGAQTANFQGKELPLAMMAPFLLSPERSTREDAWRAIASRRLQDRQTLDGLMDQMVERRHTLAKNAGLANYIEYGFKDKQRFDYTPEDCRAFWVAVEKHIVPLMRKMDRRRTSALGLSALRPWDTKVDVKGRPGLKPFDGGRDLLRKTQRVMDALDARLGGMTRRLGDADDQSSAGTSSTELVTSCLDLDSRKGKRPGGYQYQRDFSRRPFIFMNAAGLHRDVMTMVHEAGHAFHSMLAENDPLVEYRHSPIEFAEVASMSMEHLTMPHWGVTGGFYEGKPAELARAQREHLEDSLVILAWIATIDSFQHWMYRHPSHTRHERDTYWLGLDARFGSSLDWSGFEDERASQWQRQGHLFSHPLYYIEYGIAQLGALGLWLKSKREGERAAVDAYVRALTLGGSKPLPELFKAAGLELDFGEKPIASIAAQVERELEVLEAAGA
jgi:oligoendopeptidase F